MRDYFACVEGVHRDGFRRGLSEGVRVADDGHTEVAFELRLIGRVRLIRADGLEVTPKGRKAQGLLALLGVSPENRRTRLQLQDKLWSDRPARQGGASLRQELKALRRILGDEAIATEGSWVALNPTSVRIRLFPDPGDWEVTGEPPEFAAGLDIRDPEFEEWIRDQRAAFADRLAGSAPRPPDALSPSPSPGPSPGPSPSVTSDPPLAPTAAADWQMSGVLGPAGFHRPFAPWEMAGVEPPPSIAVMPLQAIADPASPATMLGAGLVQDIISRLSRYRRLDVIAYQSTQALQSLGLAPRDIGRRLGVRYLTQGTLWLHGSRMRVTFDLISAETETVLWNQVFDRACEDLFEVEGEIAGALAGGVMVEIDQLERARVRARNPDSLIAYELCVRGLDEMLRLDRAGCDVALDLFSRAAQQEVGYARALTGISRAHGYRWKYRWIEEREVAMAMAEDFALRAIDSDANDPSANAGLGWVALYTRQHERSLAAYERAMELNPSDADILAEYADTLKHSGGAEQAVPLFERAIRLNPYKSDLYLKDLAHTHFVREDFEKAIRTVNRMRRPNISALVLAASYALSGQSDSAAHTAAMIREANPQFSPEVWVTMIPDRDPSDTARLLEGLKRAGL